MYEYQQLACNFGVISKYSWVKYIRVVCKEMKPDYYKKQKKEKKRERKDQSSLGWP